eukprot:11128511-Lingulodinium_polyedra.AAC.1
MATMLTRMMHVKIMKRAAATKRKCKPGIPPKLLRPTWLHLVMRIDGGHGSLNTVQELSKD